MTDRAKKISELQATTSVANTDKLVVLKDAANASAASTRSMTMTSFANSVGAIVRKDLPGSVVVSNTVIITSNGSSIVPFFTFTDNDAGEITFHAADAFTGDVTAGHLTLVSNTTAANLLIGSATVSIGSDKIRFDNEPSVNAGVVTLYMRRDATATSNVIIKYRALLY